MSTEILKLDKDQLKFLLKNHECFSENEVKIAAKRLAQWEAAQRSYGPTLSDYDLRRGVF